MLTSTQPTPSRPRETLLLAALLALTAAPLDGQVVQGRLVDADADRSLEGAMITLLGSSGSAVGNTLTDAMGRFVLIAPEAGTYTLRAERIGFSSVEADTVRLEAGDTLTHRLETRFEAVALEGIFVEGEKRCQVRPGEGAATARVWDEARKALEAAAWTRERKGYRYRILSLERRLGPEGRQVRNEEGRWLRGFARNPIMSRPAEELAREGYARRLEDRDWTYYAPDARVLLSDLFLDTHCMALHQGEDDRGGLLGLRFEPVEGRRTPEIAGTLWLDAASAELRRLDYRYVNVEPLLDGVALNDEVGGDVIFHSLPNGAWIVQEWRIRMPLIARQGRPGAYRRASTLVGLHEKGGLVRRIETEDGETVLTTELGTVTGTVVDSTGAEPLEGAVVRLEATGRSDRTDADGRFRLGQLQEGAYRISYAHPSLEAVGFQPEPRTVEVERGGVASVRFRAPSRGEALALSCQQEWEDEAQEDVEVGTVFGVVREAGGGPPVEGATVRLFWSEWGFRARVMENISTGERTLQSYKISENRWGADARTSRDGFYWSAGCPPCSPSMPWRSGDPAGAIP